MLWIMLSMARPDKISRFLPIRFSNGTMVRRFAKHCPRCHSMVGADAMQGIASLLDNKIFLAARASCRCGAHFTIACVITDDKRVHRVMIPDFVFRFWLRLAVRNLPQPVDNKEWELAADEPSAPSGVLLPDSADVTRSSEVLGRFEGALISAWIEYEGRRYLFERAAPSGGLIQIGEHELLFEGKLIYRIA